jgi:hypothetical protein
VTTVNVVLDVTSAQRKLERGHELHEELLRVLGEYAAREPYRMKELAGDDGQWHVQLRVLEPVPDRVATLAGEVAHQLRSALDHLANALVADNGGTCTASTAFPVSRSVQLWTTNWKSLVLDKLKGASPGVIKRVLQVEPYPGGVDEWLWMLSELDNIDKHRQVLVAQAAHTGLQLDLFADTSVFGELPAEMRESMKLMLVPADDTATDGTILFTVPSRDRLERFGEIKFRFEVAFAEDPPIGGKVIGPVLGVMGKSVDAVIGELSSL